MPTEPNPPKVFISYSHDSQEHRLRVHNLLKKLRADGIHCVTDHSVFSPPEGWRAWMQDQIKEAHFTLVVCTETYRRRAERKEKPGVGLGATWEAALISDEIFRNATRNERFIPVVFAKEDVAHIPPQLGQVSFYRVDLEDGYELLLRHLTNQPLFEEPPVAEKVRELPPITRQKDFDKKIQVIGLSALQQLRGLRIVDSTYLLGEQISVSIELDAQGDENAFAFSLIFDPTQMVFLNAILDDDAKSATMNINETNSINGYLGLAIAFPAGRCISTGNGKKLIKVKFNPQASETWNVSSLQFGDRPIAREVVSAQAVALPATWVSGVISVVSSRNAIDHSEQQFRQENFTEDLGNGVKLEMIAIPGGSFQVGSEDFPNTRPVHRVTLSPFHIGKFQVTQAQWKAVMGNNPSHFKGDNLPVESISWQDASEFCLKLSETTGNEYRLPTEAEWEYTCLAGSTGKYCFGDDEVLLGDYAWYAENSSNKTHPVGEKLPNNWGLYDMHGNVWEWCSDWYNGDFACYLNKKGETVNPQGSANGIFRVRRGGSFVNFRLSARSVFREGNDPGVRDFSFGLRVVVSHRLSF